MVGDYMGFDFAKRREGGKEGIKSNVGQIPVQVTAELHSW